MSVEPLTIVATQQEILQPIDDLKNKLERLVGTDEWEAWHHSASWGVSQSGLDQIEERPYQVSSKARVSFAFHELQQLKNAIRNLVNYETSISSPNKLPLLGVFRRDEKPWSECRHEVTRDIRISGVMNTTSLVSLGNTFYAYHTRYEKPFTARDFANWSRQSGWRALSDCILQVARKNWRLLSAAEQYMFLTLFKSDYLNITKLIPGRNAGDSKNEGKELEKLDPNVKALRDVLMREIIDEKGYWSKEGICKGSEFSGYSVKYEVDERIFVDTKGILRTILPQFPHLFRELREAVGALDLSEHSTRRVATQHSLSRSSLDLSERKRSLYGV